jgi:hypothetical protein
MKIERLAGIPGTPTVELGHGREWFVCQCRQSPEDGPQVYGPYRDDERSAIRAWNAMVRRIRKANAQGLEGTK